MFLNINQVCKPTNNYLQGEKVKDKSSRFEEMEDQLKKQTRKVEKLQENIEKTIFKHTEL